MTSRICRASSNRALPVHSAHPASRQDKLLEALDENVGAPVHSVAVFELEKVDEQVEGGRDIRFRASGMNIRAPSGALQTALLPNVFGSTNIYANRHGVSNSSGPTHGQECKCSTDGLAKMIRVLGGKGLG